MPLSFHIIDPKFRRNFRQYLLQSLIASVVLLAILSVEDALDKAAVVAAIGSTAFILFITPHSQFGAPRNVIGGYVLSVLAGSLAVIVTTDSTFLLALEGASAVGLAFILMAVFDAEHGPAAGAALAVVLIGFSWNLVFLLMGSIIAMSVIHRVLRRWLRDLT